jgi:hypothetical protein
VLVKLCYQQLSLEHILVNLVPAAHCAGHTLIGSCAVLDCIVTAIHVHTLVRLISLIYSVCTGTAVRYVCIVGTYREARTAIRERDLAVLVVHGRRERNAAAPATLLPASSYSDQEVAATAVKLQQQVGLALGSEVLTRGDGTKCWWCMHICAMQEFEM